MSRFRLAMVAFSLTALGEVLFALGALVFCVTVSSLVIQSCRTVVRTAIAEEPKISGAEVRA